MTKQKQPSQTKVFLLSVWIEKGRGDHDQDYQFILEDPHTNERFGFKTLSELIDILDARMSGNRPGPSAAEPRKQA